MLWYRAWRTIAKCYSPAISYQPNLHLTRLMFFRFSFLSFLSEKEQGSWLVVLAHCLVFLSVLKI